MKKSAVHIKPKRYFSETFKKARVKEYETGEFTVNEISRLFSIKEGVIYKWIHQYSHDNKKKLRVVEMEESSTKKIKDLIIRISELERMLGQKQIRIELLEKMIDLAEKDLGIDVKKTSLPQPRLVPREQKTNRIHDEASLSSCPC